MSSPWPGPWAPVVADGHLALVLVRHGRTAWNAEHRFLGTTDVPLDEVGEAEARGLGEQLAGRFAAVYTSPLSRARATAAHLAPPEPTVVDGLQELHQGELEGLPVAEAIARYPDFFRAWEVDPGVTRVPGGEDLGGLQLRAQAALERVAAAHRGGVVAVVTHQLVIACLSCLGAGAPLSDWRRFQVPNVGATVLRWDGRALRLEVSGWRAGGPPAGRV